MRWPAMVLAEFVALPWLSLRVVSRSTRRDGLFYRMVRRSLVFNALASVALVAVFLTGLWLLLDRLPLGDSRIWPLLVMGAGVLLRGWRRRSLCALVGMSLLADSAANPSFRVAAIGSANIISWLVLIWESREARAMWMNKPLVIDSVDTGSASLLRGRVTVIHLFVDTPRRRWRPKTQAQVQLKIEKACGWIAESALHYGVGVTFDHEHLTHSRICFDGVVPCNGNNYAELDAFELFVKTQLTEFTTQGIVDTNQNAPNDEPNRCLVLHVAESIGRTAFAVPAYRGRAASLCGIEYAVIGKWSNAAVYAHEILHLFGADDLRRAKYNVPGAELWDDLSARWLRRSIMFDGYVPLDQVVVDELSAQCIGWA